MARRPLDAETLLSIHVSTRMTRRLYDHDAADCIRELEETAGARTDILIAEVASFVGFYRDTHIEQLCAGLIARWPEALDHPAFAEAGRRRAAPMHGAPPPPH